VVAVAAAVAAAADNREADVGARSAARSTGCADASDTPPAADGADDKTGGVVVDAVHLPRVVSVLGVARVHSVVEEGVGNNTAVVVVRPPPGHHGKRSHAAGTVASEAGDGALRDSAVEEAADSVDGVVAGTATVDRAAAAADNTDQNHCDVWDWSDAAAPGEDRPPDPPIVPPDETMRRPRGVAEHRPVLRPSDGADDAVRVDAADEEEEGVSNTDAESPRSSDLLLMRTW